MSAARDELILASGLVAGLVVGGVALLARGAAAPRRVWRRKRAPGPPPGDPDTWVQLVSEGPLRVVQSARAFTSEPVRALLLEIAGVAGGLVVGDVSGPLRGERFPPHVSHRWGRDVDVSYQLDRYRRRGDDRLPVAPELLEGLRAVAPWIEFVFVSSARAREFGDQPFDVGVWPGHDQHAHVRFLPETAAG